MLSAKQFIEEGFKFIIPPPKYHPYPDLPALDSSFVSEKMVSESPYHRLPEDNVPRPSMESVPGDDQRLLDTDALYDDDSPVPPPKKGIYKFKLSYHPTLYIRLLVLCLFTIAFGILIGSHDSNAIPSIVFLSFAIFRNILVLYSHLVRRWFIRIHIEIVGRSSSVNSKPRNLRSYWLNHRSVQVVVDWVLIIVLITTTIIAKEVADHDYRWRFGWHKNLVLPGCVLAWIALPLYALSTIDMGKPGRLQFMNAVSFDTSKEKEDADEAVLPSQYRDVEASGGLGESHDGMTRKTGADSPPII